jgi:hypothetical protein
MKDDYVHEKMHPSPSSGYRSKILFSGIGGRKAPNSMGKISTAGVLRLRATSTVSRDKSVRRCTQDDVFVGVLTKNISN